MTNSTHNRCCRSVCVIGGTSTLRKFVHKTTRDYYNNGHPVTVNGATVGAPNPHCIPSNMRITMGGENVTYSDTLVNSSLHYEFVKGLRITETESTITIYYPGPITITQNIVTDKDLIIMSVCGTGEIAIKANITARNIAITSVRGTVKIYEGFTITALTSYEIDVSSTLTPVDSSHITLLADSVINEGTLITSGDGFTIIITKHNPILGMVTGNIMVRNTSCGGQQIIQYMGDETDYGDYDDYTDYTGDHTALDCGTTITFTTTGSHPLELVDHGALIFWDNGIDYIIVHDGSVVLPDLSDGINRNLLVITPCDITINGGVKTWLSTGEMAQNITLIAGGTITVTNDIDASPTCGIGGVCTIIGDTININNVLVCCETESSGRIFCASFGDVQVGTLGGYKSQYDVITLSIGCNFTADNMGGDDTKPTQHSTINILVGGDFTVDTLNSSSDTGPVGGNILVACAGNMNVATCDVGVWDFSAPAGNLFITTGGCLTIDITVWLDGHPDGRAIFIVGYIATIVRVQCTKNNGLIQVYYLCSCNKIYIESADTNPVCLGFVKGQQNSCLWSSAVETSTPEISDISYAPLTPCIGGTVNLSATISGDQSYQWVLVETPIGYEGPVILGTGTTTSFIATIAGTYIAQISTESSICHSSFTCFAPQQVTIVVSAAPIVNIIGSGICFKGSSLTFTAIPPAKNINYEYQWVKDGALIPCANAATYTKPHSQTNDSGAYNVMLIDHDGCTLIGTIQVLVVPSTNIFNTLNGLVIFSVVLSCVCFVLILYLFWR